MPTPPSHKVIALISGGKDSFLAVLHCLAQKNDIVALANLYPAPTHDFPSTFNDPNESHLYQTAGHTLIHLYALALRIPLYRGQISRRGALNLERNYSPSFHAKENSTNEEDETESLLWLLQRIKESHPDASAVCSGAILSTYQRTRIESVALRLGLVPLAPLWEYPFLPRQNSGAPGGLLEDVGLVGLKARIIKVASGGLDEALLWGDLSDRKIRHRVKSGVGRFGGSILGEGGEYETIVLDGPRGVWKGGIFVDEKGLVVRRGEAGEAWLEVEDGAGRVTTEDVAGEEEEEELGGWRKRLVIPGLWDEGFQGLVGWIWSGETAAAAAETTVSKPDSNARWTPQPNTTQTPTSLHLSNLTCPFPKTSAPTQMAKIITCHLLPFLTQHSLPPSSIIFTTLLLRSISDFALLNQAYSTIFTSPLPPARVTVACGDSLPADVHVMASFVLDLTSHKDGLHVQSRSYWAPANIGPYSQAISVPLAPPPPPHPPPPPLAAIQDDLSNLSFSEPNDWSSAGELVYVAGQIPLVPMTMDLVSPSTSSSSSDATAINTTTPTTKATVLNDTDDDDEADLLSFRTQTALSLQHLFRIGKTMKISWWTGAVAFITAPDPQRKARMASQAWKIVHGCSSSSSSSVFNIKPSIITNSNEDLDDDDDDDDDGLDAWDKKYGAGRKTFCFGGGGQEGEEGHKKIPNWEHVRQEGVGGGGGLAPGFFAVEVSELPRHALVEWSSLGLRHSHITLSSPSSSSSSSPSSSSSSSSSCSIRLPPQTSTATTTSSQRKKTTTSIRSFHYIPIPLSSSSSAQPEVDVDSEISKFLHILYEDKKNVDDGNGSRRGRRSEGVEITVYTSSPKDLRHGKAGLVIPVNGVYGEEGQKLAAGVVLSLWTTNEEAVC